VILPEEDLIMPAQIGFDVTIDQPFEQALETVIAALKTQGFGVLTRIDVQATLKEKLGEDFRPYVILGACNPPLAHRALTHAPEVGLLLPCNVTVEQLSANQSFVRIANPAVMVEAVQQPDDAVMQEVANSALEKIENVMKLLQNVE
jgi:uncharacterized protein (DUF302 family)